MNSLNLRQIDGGNVIKQADFGSNLSFELLDERRRKIPELDGQTATIRLIKGDNIVYQTEQQVVDGTVSFKFDRVLEKGIYVLEIVAGNYVFPSNNMVKITIEKTAGNYKPENMVKTDLVELQGKITAIEQREHDVNQELLDVGQKQAEMTKRIEILESREDHDTIYDDTEIKERLSALEKKEDKDTIYNDTEIKQSIAIVGKNISGLADKVTALEERPIVDTALTKRVEALERKEDKDTVYDDSNLVERIENLESDDTTIKERISALEEKPDNDTIYDDTNLKAQVSELQEKLKSLNTVRRAPTGYTLDRTTTPWTIWFDNGCGMKIPDYSPRNEDSASENTIYGFGYSTNIMSTTVTSYPIPQNFIAASMGHISLLKFSKQNTDTFVYMTQGIEIINPIKTDANKYDWSKCYGENAGSNDWITRRKTTFPRVCYELGIWSDNDVKYLGATLK